jgi:Gpi18-like mannosyltransferase
MALPSVAALTWPGWLTSTYNVFQAFVPSTLPIIVSLLKLPIIACAILTGLLLRKMTGADSSVAWWIANPLVILVGSIWGQIDPIATLLALASVYYFQKEKEYHAYLLASFGAAVKIWPVLVVPIFLVISLKRRGLAAFKPLVAVLPALLVTLVVYGFYGNPLQSLFVFAYARGIPTFAGAFTVNGLTWQELLFVFHSPPIPLFLVVGIPLYAIILAWTYRKGETDVAKLMVVFLLIFYLTYNYVNPQYFYWILPFLMLQRRRLATIAFTALPLFFMFFAYNIFYFVSPTLLPDEFSFGASVLEQMKVSFFYQTPVQFLLISALIPTAVYVFLLRRELKRAAKNTARVVPQTGVQVVE